MFFDPWLILRWLPGRWHELIGNLCTDLGRERPGTEDFRINIDHKISEAEARATQSEAIPFGETPEQRKREFQEALREFRVRVPSYERPKDSPKR